MNGLDFTVRIGKAHLGVEFAWSLDLLRQRHRQLACPGVIERDRLLVGDQLLIFLFGVNGESRNGLVVERDGEVEIVVALVTAPARAQRGRHLDLGPLGRAAVEEGETQGQRHFLRCDQPSANALHATGEDRQTEIGNAEITGGYAAGMLGLAAQFHPIGTPLGVLGNLPLIRRHPPAVPVQRLAEFIIAFIVDDDHLGGQLLCVRESEGLAATFAGDVLHRHHLSGAQQGAVKHRMNAAAFVGAPGLDTETPVFDAFVPVRAGKTVVLAQTGADKDEAVVVAIDVWQRLINLCAALGVATSLPERFALARRDAHFGVGDRLAAVERRHPDQRIILAVLEMDGQIGDQRRGAHVHRFRRGQQRRAEQAALDFDDVETGFLQGNADYLEFVAAAGFGQLAAGDAVLALEEGEFAGVEIVVVFLDLVVDDELAAFLVLLLEFAQCLDGGDDLGVVREALGGKAVRVGRRHRQIGNRQAGFDIAQRDRQDAALLELKNAEATGEFGQRRQAADLGRQREAGSIGERAAALILDVGGQLDFQ